MKNLFAQRFYDDCDLRDAGFRSLGANVRIHENVNFHGIENISIGSNVRIDAYTTIIATRPVEIGSYVHIASYTLLSGGEGITIGDFCSLSHGVKIYTRSDDFSGNALTNPCVPSQFTNPMRGAVRLERHAIVGAGSVVLPGVTIAQGGAVGALSLVTMNIPEWTIYFGTPARRIRARSRKLLELEQQLLSRKVA
jgi:acetyltransferase-like isoleucine patch superfamily enzyme